MLYFAIISQGAAVTVHPVRAILPDTFAAALLALAPIIIHTPETTFRHFPIPPKWNPSILPPELIEMICDELNACLDFNTLFNLTLVSRQVARIAIPNLYRCCYLTPRKAAIKTRLISSYIASKSCLLSVLEPLALYEAPERDLLPTLISSNF